MKKNRILNFQILLFFAMLLPLISFSQVAVKWNKQFTSTIQWQEVTTLGNLIVSSGEGLLGIDSETGKIKWNKTKLSNISRDLFEELPNSPFFSIKDNSTFYLIDQFTGDEVFSSSKAGIAKVNEYFLLYNSDAILVAGQDANNNPIIVSVKMSDGSLSWSMNDKFDRIIAVNELGNDELLLVTLFNIYKLKASTGKTIWKKPTSDEAASVDKLGALGKLMKEAANNMTDLVNIDLRFYRKPDGTVFYLGSQQESPFTTISTSENPIMKYTSRYMSYNISDGSKVWDRYLEVNGKLGFVDFTENGLMILPDDGNRSKINLFDYQTKDGKWGNKGRGISIKGGIYNYMKSNDGVLLVSQTSSNDFLNYLDPKAGVITFEDPVKIRGSVVGIVPLSSSILYITDQSMNILDQSKGLLKWKNNIATSPNLTAEYEGKIYAFDLSSGIIKTIDKKTEEVIELSKTPIFFQGKESPRQLEVLEDGIFLNSDQNVAKVKFDGTTEYVKYYPAPREEGWKRALLYASAARALLISAQSHLISGSIATIQRDVAKKDLATAGFISQVGNAYSNLGTAASSYANEAFRRANARITATKSGRDFMFIMSQQDKEIVLLKVSKITGQAEGQVALGNDRTPNYAVDDITGQIYYLTGNNKITSYKAN